MKAKLYKVLDQYHLYDGDKAIATTIVGNPMLLPNLSKQNCDSLFGVFDLDDESNYFAYNQSGDDCSEEFAEFAYKEGFNKAMELNKDQVFTLEDMKNAMLNAIELTEFQKEKFRKDNNYHIALDIIQSLQQPTEIDVEIEMECLDPNCDGIDKKGVCIPGDKPKLDSEGCLILKKI